MNSCCGNELMFGSVVDEIVSTYKDQILYLLSYLKYFSNNFGPLIFIIVVLVSVIIISVKFSTRTHKTKYYKK